MGRTILIVVVVAVAVAAAAALLLMHGGGGGGGGGVVVLRGSGATFPMPALYRWIDVFTKQHPGIRIDYSDGGSGKGLSDILQHLVDFACSDPPLPRSIWEKYRGELLQFPDIAGAVVVVYNIPGLGNKTLVLSGKVLADIYLGKVKYWDDPEILELNPGLKGVLPHHEIIAVHRSDASGTTQIFTTFLSKADPEWAKRVGYGKVVNWPVDRSGRGIGAEGNPGVAKAVMNTPYSIGYVEWAYALRYNMSYAAILNPLGEPVKPTVRSVLEAVAYIKPLSPADDWSADAPRAIYAPRKGAYPISSVSFMLVWRRVPGDKCAAMKQWLRFIGEESYKYIPEGYAPLPKSLREVALKAADMLECGG